MDCGMSYEGLKDVTISGLDAMGAMKPEIAQFIEEQSASASGEAALQEDIDKIEKKWKEIPFAVTPYRQYKDKFIIKEVDEVYN